MTIDQKITEETRKLSEEIHDLKKKAMKTEKRKKLVYVDGKGKVHNDWVSGRTAKFIEVEVVVASINPKHTDWVRFQHAKREVSILLTAKAILKAMPKDAKIENLTRPDIKAMIKDGLLRHHTKRPGRIAYAAMRRLKRMAKEVK